MSEEISEVRTVPIPQGFYVRLPLPSAYTSREGERMSRGELLPIVRQWIKKSEGHGRFVIQGGNRYISEYLKVLGIGALDLKLMSLNKTPLCNQIATLLSNDELTSTLGHDVIEFISDKLPATIIDKAPDMTLYELLLFFASDNVFSPFSTNNNDDGLQEELNNVIKIIGSGDLKIKNLDCIQHILAHTHLAKLFCKEDELHCIDDLFYRGRTLYSLAVIVSAFGGNPQKIRLSTICCDEKSRALTSPYHYVFQREKLYPFENSIRTEQGYWQDTGERYVFTDLREYWFTLNSIVDSSQSNVTYTKWQNRLVRWFHKSTDSNAEQDISLIFPLLWLRAYQQAFNIPLQIDKLVDQKGYKLGACVAFAQIINRFIGQEEPVDERSRFKQRLRDALKQIETAITKSQPEFQKLVEVYISNKKEIDCAGLRFIFEEEPDMQAC